MKAEISFDLVMDEDMPFVEGTYRVDQDVWQVFIFLRAKGTRKVGVEKNIVWKSGVTGLNVVVADDTKLNKSNVLEALSDALGITEWLEIQGPDSMELR